jgi:hypothetical protein
VNVWKLVRARRLTLLPKTVCAQCALLEPFDSLSDWNLSFLKQQSGHWQLSSVAVQSDPEIHSASRKSLL